MSHVVSTRSINQFLPVEKWSLSPDTTSGVSDDHYKVEGLEETARGIVLGRLRAAYNVDGWLGTSKEVSSPSQPTPDLVVSITAMLVAGWAYDRQFSEAVAEGGTYGARKVREAYALLSGILDGTYDLGVEPIVDLNLLPSVLETEPVFTMGERI